MNIKKMEKAHSDIILRLDNLDKKITDNFDSLSVKIDVLINKIKVFALIVLCVLLLFYLL